MRRLALVLAWPAWVGHTWRSRDSNEQRILLESADTLSDSRPAALSYLRELAALFSALNPSGAFNQWCCTMGTHVHTGSSAHKRYFGGHRQPSLPMMRERILNDRKLTKQLEEEKHLLFDTADIVVKSGSGGRGEVIDYKDAFPVKGRGPVINLRRDADGNPELPPGGGDGGNIVLFVDPARTDLLHLRGRRREKLVAGAGGDSQGMRDYHRAIGKWRDHADTKEHLDPADIAKFSADRTGSRTNLKIRDGLDLRVPVPPGTFVRTKKGGRVLGDLVAPGQELIVAKGGTGGPCVLGNQPVKKQNYKKKWLRKKDEPEEEDWTKLTAAELKEMTFGGPPEELKLELILRTVADVGFVGFPNAGKSTLLRALSRASPEVAPFPFTTLMPNLGAIADGGSSTGDWEDIEKKAPILADLPGLIEGAHNGKGLGRLFLRHLRRVSVILYILDTSCQFGNVTEQYTGLRRELQLYNPGYLDRPHVVVINKLDLALDRGGDAAFTEARKAAAREVIVAASKARNLTAPPVAVVPMSGLKGKGLRMLREAIDDALEKSQSKEEPGETSSPSEQEPIRVPKQRVSGSLDVEDWRRKTGRKVVRA